MNKLKSEVLSVKMLFWIWIVKPLILIGIFYLIMYFITGIIISNLV
jgi:hypothetical protein